MTAQIGICLATYNGARFLPQQLDSIADQTFDDWHLYARDDGSTDGTQEILLDFQWMHPERVTILSDTLGRLGARDNFAVVMGAPVEPYIGFSDQDDIWRPDKLTRAHARLVALSAQHKPGMPAMVHADRRLIDADGREITPSYWRSRGLAEADFANLETYYTFCIAAGSAMLINRPLLELARPVPAEARMYDTWVELLANAFGVVEWIDEIALDHRRHGSNASGSSGDIDSRRARHPMARAARLLGNLERQRNVYRLFFQQAAAFQAMHGDHLPRQTADRLAAFLSMPKRGIVARALALWRSQAAPPGLARAVALAALAGRAAPASQGAAVPALLREGRDAA